MKNGLIFDLDGVLVDTAKYHFIAWKKLADELKLPFSKADNEKLKGVSRKESFRIILNLAGREMSEKEVDKYCARKNDIYLEYIEKLTEREVLPGVVEFLENAKKRKFLIALGSASKNAKKILERTRLMKYFDAVVDGNDVSKAKPNPEVFMIGAQRLGLPCWNCIVFEDSAAGIEAAHAGNMKVVGIGSEEILTEADFCIKDFRGKWIDDIVERL